tara:strand:- start:129 stop:1154 length:1026 start_codon:yes stop_codon:yes gene_type:complete
MNFRNFINTHLFNIIQYKNKSTSGKSKQEIFFFQIGCFPILEKNLNHEYPNFIETCKKENMNVNLVLIDPMYKDFLNNNNIRDRINNYSIPTFVYEKNISNSEYNTLIEFCHFISNFDCLSIIMEMSGIERKQFFQNENQTKYLYITDSNCLINTNDILYNPLLIKEEKQIDINGEVNTYIRNYFFSLDNDDQIYEHLDYEDPKKVIYLGAYLDRLLILAESFYCKVLSFLYIKPPNFSNDLELNYNKNYNKFNQIIESLNHRMMTDRNRLDNLLDEFFNSEYQNLEVFINKKLCYIFINYLYYKCKSNIELIELYSESILFEDVKSARNVISFLKQDLCS